MSSIDIQNSFHISFQYDPTVILNIRAIEKVKWNRVAKRWEAPISLNNLEMLQRILPKPIRLSDAVKTWYTKELEHKNMATLQRQDMVDKLSTWQYKVTPYQHQKTSLSWAVMHGSGCMFLECGLGKSKIILDLINFYLHHKFIKRALIVLPLSVANTWRDEIKKHTDIFSVMFLIGMPLTKRKELLNSSDHMIYIVNYDAVVGMQQEILDKKFDLIACDESTYIKSNKAKRTKVLLDMAKYIPMRFSMSGTPLAQRIIDVYTQVKFARPDAFPESWFAFRNRYCEMGGFKDKEYIGTKNMPELEARIKNIAKVFRKVDCLDLPPKVYETRTCELSDESKIIYKEILENLLTIVNKETIINVPDVLPQMMKLGQLCSGFIIDNQGKEHYFKDNNKLNLLKETLEEVSGKVVIFCKFRHDIHIIKTLLGNKCVEFYGDTKTDDREAAIQRFKTDPECLYFLATEAGGYGLNLAEAQTIIFYSHTWSVVTRSQQEDRVYRIGQKGTVTIIDLVSMRNGKQTMDGYVVKSCREKRDITSKIFDAIKELTSV